MVEPDPDVRITASNLFKHPFVRAYRYLTSPDYMLTLEDGLDPMFLSVIVECIVYEGLYTKYFVNRTASVISRAVNCILNLINEDIVIQLLLKEQSYLRALFLIGEDSSVDINIRNNVSSIFIQFIQNSDQCKKHCANAFIEMAQRTEINSPEEQTIPKFVSLLAQNDASFIEALSLQLSFREMPRAQQLLLNK